MYKLVFIFLLTASQVYGQNKFTDYFSDGVLRIDYVMGGNQTETKIYLDEMLKEPYWGGTRILPNGKSDHGIVRYNLYDQASGDLIYSKGYSPLFSEWQTIPEAKSLSRSMPMSLSLPFPKNKVKLEIEERNKDGEFSSIFVMNINPLDYFIRPELRFPCRYKEIYKAGLPEQNVDLVFISEGYCSTEITKFHNDVERIYSYMFSIEPYKSMKNKFNIYAIEAPSLESGVDSPGKNEYKNTVLNSTFYTFDTDRYLTVNDAKRIADISANVPCDAVIILANSSDYGGGGFYNCYAIGTTDHPLSEIVIVHEFGHSFTGLADEYYNSSVAYSDFYNLALEPWEPNITTLVNFGSKWKNMLDASTPIPTPRDDAKYLNTVGVFEGGGYSSKGIYSPMNNCIMKSNAEPKFCPICRSAIEETIIKYTQTE